MIKIGYIFLALFWSTTLVACNDSSFSGAGGTKANKGKNADSQGKSAKKGDKDPPKNGKKLGQSSGADSDQQRQTDQQDQGSEAPDGTRSDGFFPDTDTNIKSPRFAMLVNDLKCAMCHLTVNGNIASTRAVDNWSAGHVAMAGEQINGSWFAAESWTDQAGILRYPINVAGGVAQNHRGPELPTDPSSDEPAFPTMDFSGMAGRMEGSLQGQDEAGQSVSVNGVHAGNLVLIGTDANPIVIEGSVLIQGQLVITGTYRGVGSIYAQNAVFIPFDLKAASSVFPYPSSPDAAQAQGQELVKGAQGDALGLASGGDIIVGDPENSVLDDFNSQAPQELASWYPGGLSAYAALYGQAAGCGVLGGFGRSGFNLIEAYLYAVGGVGGYAGPTSWAINGGIIADRLHLLGTAGVNPGCNNQTSPVHGLPMGSNYINYDYRMSAGLRVLGEIAPYFR